MRRYSRFSIMAIALFTVLLFSTQAMAAYNVVQSWGRFSAVAAETLAVGKLVCLKTDGLAYKAKANDSALRPAIGIVVKGGTVGQTVSILNSGIVSGWSSLTEGSPGFLSETAGAVTQSSPAWSQQVGHAISETQYLFNFQNYFDTSSLTALGTLAGSAPIVLEGSTSDAYKTTFNVTDPTAARAVTIPDASFTMSGLKYYDAGRTSSASENTEKSTSGFFYSGSKDIVSGSQVVISGFSPAFTSTATYQCIVAGKTSTSPPIVWSCDKTTTSSVTITTPSTVSDTVSYVIVGH